jgi:serine/threonine protein phosphatase PrpC
MGCNTVKAAASPASQDGVVPQLRRRLSLGEIGDDVTSTNQGDVTDDDRSLMLQLTQQQVFDFIRTEGGRRYSLSSSTDQMGHLVTSFGSKNVKLEGEKQFDSAKEGIGYACKKGLKPEAPNQDSFLIMKLDDHALYGVFDGHGRKGHDISNFVKDSMPKVLLSQDCFVEDPAKALLQTFEKTQLLLVKATAMNNIDATRSGTTCSLVLHCLKQNMLYIAHVGDSRVVLGRQTGEKWEAVDLTIDHKPDLPEERARIEKAGGIVVFDGGWNYRVFARDKIDSRGKRYPGLNMSRAMGDLNGFNDAGISATPDVNKWGVESAQESDIENPDGSGIAPQLSHSSSPSVGSHALDPKRDKFILLCSDGVWEFISSEEAVREVSRFSQDEAAKAAENLAASAWERWMREMDGQVVDDITAVVTHFLS